MRFHGLLQIPLLPCALLELCRLRCSLGEGDRAAIGGWVLGTRFELEACWVGVTYQGVILSVSHQACLLAYT